MKELIEQLILEELQEAKFIRYGGTKGRKQPHGLPKGVWAFIAPHFDEWFLTGEFSNIGGRFKKDGSFAMKKNELDYEGPIFIRYKKDLHTKIYNHPNSAGFNLTHTYYLKEILKKAFASLRKSFVKSIRDDIDRGLFGQELRNASEEEKSNKVKEFINKHPDFYKNPLERFFSKDHTEVFIPSHPEKLNNDYFPGLKFKRI